MLTQLAGVVLAEAAAHEEAAPLIAPPFVIGGTMFVFLMLLMFICVSFMNLGNRHSAVPSTDDPHRQHTNKHGHGDETDSSHH
ncbi:hypothetical protein AL755_12855 [Arthrobacter sp. ERGS1:01]|uniref:hypothetical protein n=1 Tax=Arthrobacter sp. ERGS1:01 TaxID=1704044 RepID=UPI0006B5333D|nr:hypothetical protein [Arthrobacter sp. ERGS1:01]ALE06149.1 hypothetical protein AL755_12855 [Arthrobacter sp. ERGS1:01]